MNGPRENAEQSAAELERHIERLRELSDRRGLDVSEELNVLEEKLDGLEREVDASVAPVERAELARHPERPYTSDYIERAFSDFVELHGDRAYREDEAIVGGWARLEGRTVMVIGHQKGRNMKQNLRRNFGMAHPEGYRKALRLMQQAEKFGHPVVTLIDTPGAYPGIGAEERGQGRAIALNLREMAALEVPIVALVIGEGGSGGALGLGVANRVLMLENSIYSVISPEGCAAILWKTNDARDEAAAALKLTAGDLEELGVADEVIPEPAGGAQSDWDGIAERVRKRLSSQVEELSRRSSDELRHARWEKYEALGEWRQLAKAAD